MADLSHLSDEELDALIAQKKPQGPGFFGRVKEDTQNRFEKMGEEKVRTDLGQQTGVEQIGQNIGQAAGLVNDVGGEALVSTGKGIASVTPKPIKEGVSHAVQTVSKYPVVQAGIKALQSGKEAWDKFSKENPRVADDLSSAFNIAVAGIPVGKTAGAAEEAIPAVSKGISEGISGAKETITQGADLLKSGKEARSVEELHDAASNMKKASSNLYKESKSLGATFTPETAQNIMNSIDESLASTGKMHPRLHGDTMSFVDDIRNDIQKNGMDLERLDQHRQWLQEVKTRNTDNFGRLNSDGHKADMAIKAIDDSVEKLKPTDIAKGDPKAINALLQARAQWKAARKFESVTDAISKADGDISKAKGNIKKLINSKRAAAFTPDEIEALKKASSSGSIESIMKIVGKVGIDEKHTALPLAIGLGSAAMHAPGGIPLVMAGTGAKSLEKLIGQGKIEDALRILESKSPQAMKAIE